MVTQYRKLVGSYATPQDLQTLDSIPGRVVGTHGREVLYKNETPIQYL